MLDKCTNLHNHNFNSFKKRQTFERCLWCYRQFIEILTIDRTNNKIPEWWMKQ